MLLNYRWYERAIRLFKEIESMVEDYQDMNDIPYGRDWREFNEAVFSGWVDDSRAFLSLWYESYESFIDYEREYEELEAVTASMVRKAVDQESEADVKAGKIWGA